MKTINWNLGLAIIKIGYKIRKYDLQPKKFNFRWLAGVFILKLGYGLRGNVPQKNWN